MSSWGAEGFERHFEGIYDWRWTSLRDALARSVDHVAMLNPLLPVSTTMPFLPEAAESAEGLPGCYVMLGEREFVSPNLLEHKPFVYYLLDGASVMAPMALDVKPGERVLDMCAAPGGKSVWLSRCLELGGLLTVNEIDAARRARLSAVMTRYIPEAYQSRVTVESRDATTWSRHQRDHYDAVLVDAPCSSERHLIHDEHAGLSRWTASRTEEMASLQYAILSAALDAVRPGGRIVYSTCSISPTENDDVISRLLQRRGRQVEVMPPLLIWGEPTELGWQVFPDVTGWGPLYISALRRTQ